MFGSAFCEWLTESPVQWKQVAGFMQFNLLVESSWLVGIRNWDVACWSLCSRWCGERVAVDLDSNLNDLDEYRMHLYEMPLYYTILYIWFRAGPHLFIIDPLTHVCKWILPSLGGNQRRWHGTLDVTWQGYFHQHGISQIQCTCTWCVYLVS